MKKYLSLILLTGLLLAGILSVPGTVGAEETIVFGDLSWDSAQVHNRIAGFIVEHGYGYDVDYKFGQTKLLLLGLERGDIDVAMEVWTQNWGQPFFEAIKENIIIDLGATYPPSPQEWYVPTYVIEGDEERGIEPMAPELESVKDLKKYWKLFADPAAPEKGRFYNGPSGWQVYPQNIQKLETYGLDKYYESFDPGSQTALATAIMSAYKKGEPILAYYWEPTWLMGLVDMTKLKEPAYDKETWEKNKGCAFPLVKVHIGVNSELPQKAPGVITFLANYETTMEETNSMLGYLYEEEASPEEAAIWFLKEYRQVWHEWFRSINEDIIPRVEKTLEEE